MNAIEEYNKLYNEASSATDGKSFSELFEFVSFKGDEEAYSELVSHFSISALNIVPQYAFSSLQSLFVQNPHKDDFYEKLRTIIFESPVLATDDDKRLAFLVCLMSESMPYEHVDAISMDEEEYSERRENMQGKIEEIVRLANRPFLQKTESASVLMDIIDSESDKRDRAVLFAAAIAASQPSSIQD